MNKQSERSGTSRTIQDFYDDCKEVWRTRDFWTALVGSISSALLSCTLHLLDTEYKLNFLTAILPDAVIFNVFFVFTSLLAGFRTSHAFDRYTDAACYLHQLSASWFDTCSTLFSFCRVAEAPESTVRDFQQTLIRLVSLLNGFALDDLADLKHQGSHRHVSFPYEVMGTSELDLDTQNAIYKAEHKVECVFQMVQQLLVDNMKMKVLSIPPPILTRSFQDLANGMMVYHEARKLSRVPMPFGYRILTVIILFCCSTFVPFVVASYVRGAVSAFVFTGGGMFWLIYINNIADSLNNPFSRTFAPTLRSDQVQRDLNAKLEQLFRQFSSPTPTVTVEDQSLEWSSALFFVPRESLSNLDRVNGRPTIERQKNTTFTQFKGIGLDLYDETSGGDDKPYVASGIGHNVPFASHFNERHSSRQAPTNVKISEASRLSHVGYEQGEVAIRLARESNREATSFRGSSSAPACTLKGPPVPNPRVDANEAIYSELASKTETRGYDSVKCHTDDQRTGHCIGRQPSGD